MKYVPKLPDDSVNVSNTNFFSEALKLLMGVVVLLGAAYIVLMVVINLVVDNLSFAQEKKLQAFFYSKKYHSANAREKYLQSIADDLSRCAKLPYKINVVLSPAQEVNAMAMIGGTIIMTQGMMEAVHNENELSFVLGHEIGHFKHRDHLKGVSSGLILSLFSMAIGNSSSASIINQILQMQQMQYSKTQESHADTFGVDMLMCRYHSAVGASDLFSRMIKEDRWSDFMLTHPNFAKRVGQIEHYIDQNALPRNGTLVELKQ